MLQGRSHAVNADQQNLEHYSVPPYKTRAKVLFECTVE